MSNLIMCNTAACTRREIHVCTTIAIQSTQKAHLALPPSAAREICPQMVRGSPTYMPNHPHPCKLSTAVWWFISLPAVRTAVVKKKKLPLASYSVNCDL